MGLSFYHYFILLVIHKHANDAVYQPLSALSLLTTCKERFYSLSLISVCPGKPADIVFIIDESSSIWPVHFERQRDFIANLTDSFDVGRDETRIAAVTFADKVTYRFGFDAHDKNENIRAAIKAIDQKTGGEY